MTKATGIALSELRPIRARLRVALQAPRQIPALLVRPILRGPHITGPLANLLPWWDRWPGRLERELDELDSAGIDYARDDALWAAGHLRLRLNAEVGGRPMAFVADFPATYPYFRVEVASDDLALNHHQDPFSKTLCLFGRDTGEWSPSFTLARVFIERLPLVVEAGNAVDSSAVESLEEQQAEPRTEYFPYARNGMLIVESDWDLGAQTSGALSLNVELGAWPLRGAVTVVHGAGSRLAEASTEIAFAYPNAVELQGRWVQLSSPPSLNQADALLDLAARVNPNLARPIWKNINGHLVDVLGVAFPDEAGWRDVGIGWVFIVRTREGPHAARVTEHIIRAGRAGLTDMSARSPDHVALHKRTVAVVGLGALGAPSAIELARAGIGNLHVLDFDHVDPGTISRWPIGIGAVGMMKTDAIGGFLAANYPSTKTLAWNRRLGQPVGDGTELEVLEKLLAGVDLVYDASAEIGVQHLLSDLAQEHQVPYVAVSTTYGARGGLVATIRPQVTSGCWLCLQYALASRTIEPPPSDPDGHVQPVGCASPTFTGAGYDTLQVALAGVRTAVGILTDRPGPGWDVLVMRNENPVISTCYRLDRHPSCDRHLS